MKSRVLVADISWIACLHPIASEKSDYHFSLFSN